MIFSDGGDYMDFETVDTSDTQVYDSSFCDGRKMRDRRARREFHCTCCGHKLPEDPSEWGLIWDSKKHGFCTSCLSTIRERAKVKPRRKRKSKS